jgi:steroid delta-isomerase
MLEAERVRSVVDAYVDTYRRDDKQACIDLFAPDAVWHDPVGEPPHVGHEGIGAFWDQARAMAESIVLEPKDVIVCANQAAMVFEIHANFAGGSGMVIDAVEIFVLDDEARIAQLSAYWDMSRARPRA